MLSSLEQLCLLLLTFYAVANAFPRRSCEPISIPGCKSLPYNLTRFPNALNHLSQFEAAQNFQRYNSLIRTNCSEYLEFLLCTQSLPICLEDESMPHHVLPCRSVCRRVKQECMATILSLGGTWPSEHDCNLLPERSAGVCVTPESFVSLTAIGESVKTSLTSCAPKNCSRNL